VSDVRSASLLDAGVLSDILAAAFDNDPVMNWVFPDAAARPAQLRILFFGLAGSFLPKSGTVHLLDDACASFWRPPGRDEGRGDDHPSDASAGDSALPFSGDAVVRLRLLGAAMASAHPSDPHWYLNVLGTKPERQSQGLGARVIGRVLDTCDADGVPAYLESSNPANIPFYRRQGFETTGEITLPEGPSLYAMWRDPRS
jgi:GNAT superfamily N-acetyltransferase